MPVIITGALSKEFATCTVDPDALPSFTDLRKEWGDVCSLGRNGEQYFLLLVDKTTEYYVTLNTITCEAPVDLLQEYMTFSFSLADLFASYVSITLLTCR